MDGRKWLKRAAALTAALCMAAANAAVSFAASPLKGKLLLFDGDSICSGFGSDGVSYPELLEQETGCVSLNCARDGSTVSVTRSLVLDLTRLDWEHHDYWLKRGGKDIPVSRDEWESGNQTEYLYQSVSLQTRMNRTQELLDAETKLDGTVPDLICLEGWYYDYCAQGKPEEKDVTGLSRMDAADKTAPADASSFAGGMEMLFRYYQQTYPGVPILWVIPHRIRERDSRGFYHDAALAVCEKYGVSVADLTKECALDTRDDAMRRQYTFRGNGIHPTEEAYRQFYLPVIRAHLEELICSEGSGTVRKP